VRNSSTSPSPKIPLRGEILCGCRGGISLKMSRIDGVTGVVGEGSCGSVVDTVYLPRLRAHSG
jgi:hypothetical protein